MGQPDPYGVTEEEVRHALAMADHYGPDGAGMTSHPAIALHAAKAHALSNLLVARELAGIRALLAEAVERMAR